MRAHCRLGRAALGRALLSAGFTLSIDVTPLAARYLAFFAASLRLKRQAMLPLLRRYALFDVTGCKMMMQAATRLLQPADQPGQGAAVATSMKTSAGPTVPVF